MASEEHVGEVNSNENEDEKKYSRKIEKTILDNFTNLVKPQEKIRIKSSVNLLRHLAQNESEENVRLSMFCITKSTKRVSFFIKF